MRETAVHFDTIEGLLQGIRPRRKLFLLDTCQSGELDGTDEMAALADASQRGLASRGIQKTSTKIATAAQTTRMAVNRDRYIYNDLLRRSGAIVLSSSRGNEWSYEADALKNGVFTYEVLAALTSKAADKNGNGRVSTEELRAYVMTAVEQRTAGLQHPVVDRDNLEMEFQLPIVNR
jgi:uncharacterized caspase-like protein